MAYGLHSPERWKRVEALFHESLEIPSESRAAFLAERCGSDAELRKEVEALLAAAGKSFDVVEQPIARAARDFVIRSSGTLFPPGRTIAHYEIISRLGAGGMGEVYLARDAKLRRKVAIKILTPSLINDERGLRRFEQEALAASALNHPNILTIFEFGQAESLYFIVSEYVDGQTLRHKLAGGPLEPSLVVDISIQIAKALDAAHSAGIVHRDVKPDNVVIRDDALVKVLDFGIAKLAESPSGKRILSDSQVPSTSLSQAGLVIGSARYMSPEQARGQLVDARSDLFSLGVVLYEMIAGRAPFHGETPSDVIADILKGTLTPVEIAAPAVPLPLRAITARALCKERERRYQSAKEMLADLQEFQNQLQLHAQLQKTPPPAQPPSSDSPASPQFGKDGMAEASGFPYLSGARSLRAQLRFALLLLAVLGLTYTGFMYRRYRQTTEGRPRSLAILPFRNLRQDPALDYLGFSLADATITKLGYIRTLAVRPSSSVDKYKNQNVDPLQVGRELNVDTLLTGGFIKDSDDLRITAQLVDLKSNRMLWQDSIDVKYDKLLTVQDRVSQEIVKGLELNLSAAEAQHLQPEKPVDSQAYEDYLRGIDLYSSNDFAGAIALLEKSASIDPNYAPTWAHLGRAYTTSASLHFGGRQQYDKAQAAYEKAMALNPGLAELRVYMANMLTDTGRVEQAVPILRAALQNSPNNAELHWELGYAYRFAGMLHESVAECERARHNDPGVKITSSALNAYLYLGEYEKFLQSLPAKDSAYVVFYRGFGEYYKGYREQAARDFDRAYLLDSSMLPSRIGRSLSNAMAGRHAAAVELLHQTETEIESRGVGDAEGMFKIVQAYAVLGEKSSALHMLQHTVEGGFFCYPCFVSDPLLETIRSEPEYQRLIAEARERQEQFKARFF
jgi:eukaryotic-like serine/threonine-protein kinase